MPRLLKPAVFVALSAPLIWLLVQIIREIAQPASALGADPGEATIHFLGEWALRSLLLALTVSPLYQVTRLTAVARLRRMAGLFAFTYVSLHLLAYLFFYTEFSLNLLWDDFSERIYITAGIAAFVCLLPMALTSTRGWQRRLGRRWRQLHRLVFPAALLAVLHFWWLTKDQYGEVVAYAVWLAVLLGYRAYRLRRSA